jgi:hypothetical protein
VISVVRTPNGGTVLDFTSSGEPVSVSTRLDLFRRRTRCADAFPMTGQY